MCQLVALNTEQTTLIEKIFLYSYYVVVYWKLVMYIRGPKTDKIKHDDCLCYTLDFVSVCGFVVVITNTTYV